jgi:hypothetical protein
MNEQAIADAKMDLEQALTTCRCGSTGVVEAEYVAAAIDNLIQVHLMALLAARTNP